MSSTSVLGIPVSECPDLLCGEEDAHFVEEKIEVMRVEHSSGIGVEHYDVLVEIVEGLDALRKHLLLHLIEDLIRFVTPVHCSFKFLYMVITLQLNRSCSE